LYTFNIPFFGLKIFWNEVKVKVEVGVKIEVRSKVETGIGFEVKVESVRVKAKKLEFFFNCYNICW